MCDICNTICVTYVVHTYVCIICNNASIYRICTIYSNVLKSLYICTTCLINIKLYYIAIYLSIYAYIHNYVIRTHKMFHTYLQKFFVFLAFKYTHKHPYVCTYTLFLTKCHFINKTLLLCWTVFYQILL